MLASIAYPDIMKSLTFPHDVEGSPTSAAGGAAIGGAVGGVVGGLVGGVVGGVVLVLIAAAVVVVIVILLRSAYAHTLCCVNMKHIPLN